MVASPWDEIHDLVPDVESPATTLKGLFSPIYEKTNQLVIYELQEVSFFPEEVTFTNLVEKSPFDALYEQNPHPDFGYDPNIVKEKEYFRYRLLLLPKKNPKVEYELFKVKYPLLFYPLEIFTDEKSFPELANLSFFNQKKTRSNISVIIDTEEHLNSLVRTIIKSKGTRKVITRLMAIQ